MFIDIVFPKNNEKAFIKTAEKLDIQGVCFVYDKARDLVKSKSDVQLFRALLVRPPKLKNRLLTIAKSSAKDRNVLENGVDVIYGLGEDSKQDSVHFRRSGLNQVHCTLANKNRIIIALPISHMRNSTLIGRWMQNITLCQKYEVEMCLASFATSPWQLRASHDLKSVGVVLGMQPAVAASSLETVYKRLVKKVQGLPEGIEIC
ncbi:MAG: hypothetical protein ABIG95_06105 [Candidatus Woesearchaeota archaeon]